MDVSASCAFVARRLISLSTLPCPGMMGRGPAAFPQWQSRNRVLPGPTSPLPSAGVERGRKGRKKRICAARFLLSRGLECNPIVPFRLLPVTAEPAQHTDLQRLPVGGLEVMEHRYKESKACLGNSDTMIIAVAYNHT